MGKLDGKVALISGSGRGIGRAVALKLAQEGARVVINDLDQEPAAEALAAVEAAGGEAVACNGNVTEPDFGERFVQTALDNFGGVDIIVNNAGYTWDNVVHKMNDDQFQAMLDVHLTAPFRIMRAAAEPIRIAAKKEAQEGRRVTRKVVNISSVAGLFGNAGQINYAAGKAGIIGMTRTMCKEWGRYNVTVNCVAFGLIETRLTQKMEAEQATIDIEGEEIKVGVNPSLMDALTQMVPLGRPGVPEDAAGAIYLFCCPESDYVSGQVLVCAGGLLM
ncbi:MAG: SDR family oxidoreductase [Alphaproteobacteria bacterium]|jgi:3-oxoacyl-[acyl-carrier protein] reductase|nr:3-oxoacyl-ACP reductase [Rhodospirillaceae bacterium]MDP6403937.1 SDR family oxidoreductase [Alphaproteobacteria bacterium]MDP6622709.1 SDR family oxidoreductase [Alphaproteobacteria bacterium]|tara:strand:+ start:961 stop:1788 length:828 start_codon:yes stop_codon:yes gene_type:complete